MSYVLQTVVIFLGLFVIVCDNQNISAGNNIYDSLQPLDCGQFLAILSKAPPEVRLLYQQTTMEWTVVIWNDTAFRNLPPSRQFQLQNMNSSESEKYVKAFTLPRVLNTTDFDETTPERSNSPLRTNVFFTKRISMFWTGDSGSAGPTNYYVNGGLVIRPNIPAGQSLIHIIDRVLEPPSEKSAYAYISQSSGTQPDTAFYSELLLRLTYQEYYQATISPLITAVLVTVFVPTREAIGRIPNNKLDELRGNQLRLNDVIRQHIIVNRVMYTSFVYHNEGAQTLFGSITFRTSTQRETTYVTSGRVTAQLSKANNTVYNGVVHFIDTLLGYVYNTAKDEIELNSETSTFESIMIRARNDLQQSFIAPAGVTIFVPTNTAFNNIPQSINLMNNQTLINKIIELSMLEQGLQLEVTRVYGGYESRLIVLSRYFRRPITIYSQGNETWVESGYVKSKVIRADIGVTNGYVHFIDGVPGVPTHDVPNTIFCEDWLIKSYQQLEFAGLNRYLRDPSVQTVAPCASNQIISRIPVTTTPRSYYNYPQGIPSTLSRPYDCGEINRLCSFTVFIPNGTAIDTFENSVYGKQIQSDANRYQWVLNRHITRDIIYIDQTAVGAERTYQAVNGDFVRYRKISDRYSYIYFEGKQAVILHSDLGATNGVVHIVDAVLFVPDDLVRDVSPASPVSVTDDLVRDVSPASPVSVTDDLVRDVSPTSPVSVTDDLVRDVSPASPVSVTDDLVRDVSPASPVSVTDDLVRDVSPASPVSVTDDLVRDVSPASPVSVTDDLVRDVSPASPGSVTDDLVRDVSPASPVSVTDDLVRDVSPASPVSVTDDLVRDVSSVSPVSLTDPKSTREPVNVSSEVTSSSSALTSIFSVTFCMNIVFSVQKYIS